MLAFRTGVDALREEMRRGTDVLTELSALPHDQWGDHLRTKAGICFGVLDALLSAAHEELDRDPLLAHAITTFVLAQVETAEVPTALQHLRPHLIGTAWKEHANACVALARYPDAEEAASCALAIFSADPILVADANRASFILAVVCNATGRSDAALELLRRCEDHAFAQQQLVLQAMTMRGAIHYDREQYQDALRVWLNARREAERQHDDRERARILNNMGRCALKLDDASRAMPYLQEALGEFMRLGMDAEAPRAIWSIALALRQSGEWERANAELQAAYEEFLRRGMETAAATVGACLLETPA